jgi:hypothetical protein
MRAVLEGESWSIQQRMHRLLATTDAAGPERNAVFFDDDVIPLRIAPLAMP